MRRGRPGDGQKVDGDKKMCCRCNTFKLRSEFSTHRATSSGLHSWCKECLYAWKKNKYVERSGIIKPQMMAARRRLKQQMVDAYGGCCSCCGEDDLKFLTLEHKNRDGKIHRLSFRSGQSTWADLRRRGWPKEEYTVMCMNCNWASRFDGVCPHTLKPVAYGWCV